MSAEEIRQTLSEFDAYFNHFSQIEPKEEGYKDAGHTWIAFTDKWERWKKELLAYASQQSASSSGKGAGEWVKASERLPEGTSGYAKDIVYKIHRDSGTRLMITTVNQFLDDIKYRIKEKYEWLDPTASLAADSMRVSMTKDDIIDFAKKLIFSYENSGNPAGELIPDCDTLINNLFQP